MKNSKNNLVFSDESKFIEINKINFRKPHKNKCNHYIDSIMISLLIINLVFIIIIFFQLKRLYLKDNKTKIDFDYPPLETIDLNILGQIQNKIVDYVELNLDEQKFFNGLLRKIKPRKIVEIGVSSGGSATIILNAIKDIEGAKLYSIDKLKEAYKFKGKEVGFSVYENFPELINKWNLNTGGITSEFIEKIGGNIDLAFLDTTHSAPGEMLDWLQVLPFLKEEAIVVFHDTFLMYLGGNVKKEKRNYSNTQLLNYIRGELILPSYGNSTFNRNIAALKLDKGQKHYYKQYFLALGTQWEYMPEERDLAIIRAFILKYYGEHYVEIYDDAVMKNKLHLNKSYLL